MIITAFIYLFNTALMIYTFFGFGQSTLRNVFYSLSKIFNSWWWIRKVCLFENENEFYFFKSVILSKMFWKDKHFTMFTMIMTDKESMTAKNMCCQNFCGLYDARNCVCPRRNRGFPCVLFSVSTLHAAAVGGGW